MENKWISVEDKLPKTYQSVLCYEQIICAKGKKPEDYFYVSFIGADGKWRNVNDCSIEPVRPLFWRELPNKP